MNMEAEEKQQEEGREIICCRLVGSCKSNEYLLNGVQIQRDDFCIVDSDKGLEAAIVSSKVFVADEKKDIKSLKKVLRKATDEDMKKLGDCRRREKEVMEKALKKVNDKKLAMKIVNIECSFDNSKIVFYFTADGRIDFRELVKDLAYEFRTRIEMRQIGVRDQARMCNGFGHCGRQLCCTSFLEEFEPVTIKMAKAQNLTLNPNKLSGVCGRLMCCLIYEYSSYREVNRNLPKYGKKVELPDGKIGIVRKINTLAKKLLLELEDNSYITTDAEDVKLCNPPVKSAKKPKE